MEENKEVNEIKETKKKPNIVVYTILMTLCFAFITELIIWGYGSDVILNALKNYPKGDLVISEAVLASLVLIIMLLFKNSYVFTQKREKLTKGFYYGMFHIIGIVLFMLLYGVLYGGFKGGHSIINLLIGCFFVGVAEELLCRGWLLNEFLERFGDTKRGVWYSIVVSGIIFGLLHLGNIYTMGQAVPTTIMQVISAAATGIIFGLIYYKTKNIWSVIIIHGLWDFSLFLGEIAPVTQETVSVTSFSVVGMIFSLLMCGAELLNIIPYVKDIDAEPKKSSVISCACVGFGLFLVFTIISGVASLDMGDTYNFDSISINEYALTRDNYEEYYMKNNDYSFKLSESNGNLVFTNMNTNYSTIIECESLYDYIIMEDEYYYILAYIDYTDSSNSFLKYAYIMKDSISNENSFVDSIKNRIKDYLISERSELLVLSDRNNNKKYVTAYNEDYGYYLLVEENKMSILNRD